MNGLFARARPLARRAFQFALGLRSLVPASKRAIFAYHDVSPPHEAQHSPQYSTTPEVLQRHLDLLQDVFDLVSLDEIVGPGTGGRPRAAITFDDGFASVLDRAWPILQARGIPIALFLNGRAVRDGRLDYLPRYDPPPQPVAARFYLGPAEVRTLADAGAIIGSHTTNHRPLAGCDDTVLDDEIVANKRYLEEITGAPVRHFAIPYGKKEHYDDRALARAFAAGHVWVHGTNPTLFDEAALPGFARRPVPRIGLTGETPREVLFLINRPLFRALDL